MVGQRRAMQYVPASKDLRADLGRLFVRAENDPSELDSFVSGLNALAGPHRALTGAGGLYGAAQSG
jgi:hypothetical protein